MKICPKCSKAFEGNFCSDCGISVDTTCPKCNIAYTGKFCSNCGYSAVRPPPQYQQQPYQPQYQQAPPIIINNTNTNTVGQMGGIPKSKDKWVALLLCFFIGFLGAHKFYEGKILLGVVYLLTGGLCGVGVIIDFICLLFKPNPYYC